MANSHDSTEPVAWAMPKGDGTFIDVITPAEHAREEGSYTVPLFAHPVAQQPQYEAGDMASAAAQGFRDGVASVAQQPPKLEDIEQYRMQMAGISTAAMGYWKEGDSIHPDYDTPALRDVAKLYAKYDALYKAQQPQARPDFTDEWTGYLKDGETPFERFLRERKDVQSVLKLYQRALEENERLKAQQPQAEAVPVDMVLYCPKCGTQHIDMKEIRFIDRGPNSPPGNQTVWDNPPHKSHLCHGCGHIWRPSDTPTNGVEATASGKDADTAPKQAEAVPLDVGAMELAESVGLIGPASRSDDFHAAIQRFHDLISMNVSIKAAVHFAQGLPKKGGAA